MLHAWEGNSPKRWRTFSRERLGAVRSAPIENTQLLIFMSLVSPSAKFPRSQKFLTSDLPTPNFTGRDRARSRLSPPPDRPSRPPCTERAPNEALQAPTLERRRFVESTRTCAFNATGSVHWSMWRLRGGGQAAVRCGVPTYVQCRVVSSLDELTGCGVYSVKVCAVSSCELT